VTFEEECQNLLDRYASCYRQGDAGGCAAIFALDAEMYSAFAPPAIGRQAIEAAHREWVREGAGDKLIEVSSAGRSADLGRCIARFSEREAENGISVNVLARQPDGDWLITHCSLTGA